MNIETIGSLAVALASVATVAIAAVALYKQERTRRLASANFQTDFKQYYLKWRDLLGTLELDPSPSQIHRSYTETERRKIRDYWPKVTLVELEQLEHRKSVDRKVAAQSRKVWEQYVKEGIAHRSILQEFCYYEKYEDPGHGPLREEMIRIVRALYRSANGKELNCNEVLLEREKYTQGPN